MTPTYQLGGRSPKVWTDCYGNEHLERVANVPDHDGAVPRVQGALEARWARAGFSERSLIAAELLAQQNPSGGWRWCQHRRLATPVQTGLPADRPM